MNAITSTGYDLHSHTTISDGTLTPTELVERAHARGVETLAVTDHDVTDGIAEAAAAAACIGLRLVPGVEVSVTWNGRTIHIVGLGIDPWDQTLQQGLRRLREFRNWRAREIDRCLAKKRIAGTYEGATRRARGAILSRTHFARELAAQGHARDAKDAFKRFLARGKPGHVPGRWAPLAEAVSWIRAARGTAVIAHPARYRLTAGKLRRLINEFKEYGGSAIEVVSGAHAARDAEHFARVAIEAGLLASVGSDYHGPETGIPGARKPWSELGKLTPLPAGCVPVWHAW